MVTYLTEEHNVSERRACRVLDQNRQTQRYESKQPDLDRPIVDRINDLSIKHPRYGYRKRPCSVVKELKSIWTEFIDFGEMKDFKNQQRQLRREVLEVRKMRAIWIPHFNQTMCGHMIFYLTRPQMVEHWRFLWFRTNLREGVFVWKWNVQ